MCLINFQFDGHPKYKLILAANRDEFYLRPTETAHFWKDHPTLLAGRDLMQMGTWLGVTTSGRIAALTNFRDPSVPDADKISRGAIVRNFLSSDIAPREFLENLVPVDYAGFNLLAGDANQLFYYNNIDAKAEEVEPGIHGLSNHFLDTPWPKVVKGAMYLERYLSDNQEIRIEDLFAFLQDADQADEGEHDPGERSGESDDCEDGQRCGRHDRGGWQLRLDGDGVQRWPQRCGQRDGQRRCSGRHDLRRHQRFADRDQ